MQNNRFDILLYHGVTKSLGHGIENFSHKHILESDFIAQTKFLKNNKNVISLDELLYCRMYNQSLPNDSVIITFDDGFENNYSVACPILSDLGLSAIFYVSSGLIGSNRMFWVDILEDCLNLTEKKSIFIELESYIELSLENNKKKLESLQILKNYCKSATKEEYDRVINDVQVSSDIQSMQFHSENYRNMSWSQVKEIDKESLFAVGGHSMHHDILTSMPIEDAKIDVEVSISLLKYHLEHEIIHYSYPEGQANHYNDKIISYLKSEGIICCPSAIDGDNNLMDDPFHYKRKMVGINNQNLNFFK